jgi:N-acetylmuramoyl-L-alanine amidase
MYKEKVNYRFLAIIIIAGLAFSSFHQPKREGVAGKIQTIVLDAGHGGKDPGCHGVEAQEKNVTLAIVQKVRDLLKAAHPDMKVVLTRDDDTFIELHNRAKKAGDVEADFFVSIHCNANTNKTAYGTETYVMGLSKEDANLSTILTENKSILMEDNYEENYEGFDPTDKTHLIYLGFIAGIQLEQSIKLASKVEGQFKEKIGRSSRGVKQAGFLVLWRSSKPAILIETGFLTNVDEEKFLFSETGQTHIANAVVNAIEEYNKELE